MKQPTMRNLDLATVQPRDAWLVEASAGTGKTYTIAGLYLLLVVEEGLQVEQILVVTFTKAATAELRDRIRRRLVEARDAFVAGGHADAFLTAVIERSPDPVQAVRRLERAVVDFDQAAVFTIHGFCQRALVENAFESGSPFEAELLADQNELVQEVLDDYWRREIATADTDFVVHLVGQRLSPESLRRELAGYLAKPYLELRGPEQALDLRSRRRALLEAWQAARACWQQDEAEVRKLLLEYPGLNRRSYRKDYLGAWLEQLAAYLVQAPSGTGGCDKLERFTPAALEAATKDGHAPPCHRLFDLCAALESARRELAEAYVHNFNALKRGALMYLRQELPERKRRQQVQSFDDLLGNLYAALEGPAGEKLLQSLRARYRAALIDEFQDTDPLQYTIFSRVFLGEGVPLFLVGDPKQAIYNFRGADVYAYLDAKSEIPRGYTLGTNWRSDAALIRGVNALFMRAEQPFLLEAIDYPEVAPADKPSRPLVDGGRERPPLQFWYLDANHCTPQRDGETLSKDKALPVVAEAVAAEIARLLGADGEGASLDGKPVEGGHIAVLVRKHFQGTEIVRALQRRGIACVQQSRDKVFGSQEARELERLLIALAEPGNEGALRAALASSILGLDGAALHALVAEEESWNRTLTRFQEYSQLWREHGFMRCFRSLLVREDVHARLLAYSDGERRLTNLLHLGELLHNRSCSVECGLEGLLNWFSERCRDPAGEEEAELRLESDEKLVKVVTIHASKGLEYPIVFCPYLWDGPAREEVRPPISYHDPAQGQRAVLDFGSDELLEAAGWAAEEALAEDLRLAYVALTRARHRCYVVWGKVSGAAATGLGWLLHGHRGGGRPLERLAQCFKETRWSELSADLEALAAAVPDSVAVERLPSVASELLWREPTPAPELAPRIFRGGLRPGWRLTSFSALAGQSAASEQLRGYEPERRALAPLPSDDSIFAFPRGGRPGSCLHAILEQWEFTAPAAEELRELTGRMLNRFGFEERWTETVSAMIERVLGTPLDAAGRLRLEEVGRDRRLDELEFHYPIARCNADGLRAVLRAAGAEGEGVLPPGERLQFSVEAGFMRGFIDLVFEHEGRFYLADYKSNWLGAAPEEYAPERLGAAMNAHHYHLQYLIYTVALHRYLAARVPDYDYARHFGGVYYLFLRGMDPQRPGSGVWFTRPAQAAVERLDSYLRDGVVIEEVDHVG